MRKKFKKLLCLSLVILCMVSSIPIQTDKVLAGDGSIVQEGCIEITSSAGANDSLIYFKQRVKGAVTVEYDVKFNQFQGAVFGFGLMSDSSAPNPYASKLFFVDSQSFYTPWSPAYVAAPTTWQNYNENYWGVYMYHRVRIKLVVAENGDATLYAKSIEPSSSYAGSNSQQTEYVQVSDTIKGIYSTETAATNGAYITMFFRGGAQSMYYYGMKATDSTGAVYTHDLTNENLSDDFIVSNGFATAMTNNHIIYTQAVVDKTEEEAKFFEFDISDVTFTQGGADGYNLPYLKFVVTESESSAWGEYSSELIEYKRADGAIEAVGNLVCINADSNEMQLRLAGTGEQWELKNGDTVTFKKGMKIVENDTRVEQLVRERKFTYVTERQAFLDEQTYQDYINGNGPEEIQFDISDVTFTQGGSDGYDLPYLKFVVTESESPAWVEYSSELIEYKRADGTIEKVGNLVCINAEANEMQLRLAGTGEQWELKDGDTVIFKKGLKIAESDTRVEKLGRDRKFIYIAEIRSFMNEKQYQNYLNGNGPEMAEFDILKLSFVQSGADGYNLPYLLAIVSKSESPAWVEYSSEMVEYKRADGKIELVQQFVCINADANEMQLRLADVGTKWELKDGDTVTFKKGLGIVNTADYKEVLAKDTKFIYVKAEDAFLSEKDYKIYKGDKEGALVFTKDFPQDGKLDYKVKLTGAMTITVDASLMGLSAFGIGLQNELGVASPYESKALFMTSSNVYTPWATQYLPEPIAYTNGYIWRDRMQLTLKINEQGDLTVYDSGVQIVKTIKGIYAEEVKNGGYLTFFARPDSAKGYIYKIKVTDALGNKLANLDFSFDILNAENFFFSSEVEKVLGKAIYRQVPTGKYIKKPTAELHIGNIPGVVYVGDTIELTPQIVNQAKTDVLTISIDDVEIKGTNHVFEKAGTYMVKYLMKDSKGNILDQATVVILAKDKSTQPSAECNFNQGYFDNRMFTATAGVRVVDKQLLFKNKEDAMFLTKGYSENFILTFDVTSYTDGTIKAVFGVNGTNEYAFEFLDDGQVSFNGESYQITKNIYTLLKNGNTVTVRIKVFGSQAELYLRSSDESVENIDIPLMTVDGIAIVGQTGIAAVANSEFTIDNIKFINLTTVKDINTNTDLEEPKKEVVEEEKPSTNIGQIVLIVASVALVLVLAVSITVHIVKKRRLKSLES